MRDLYYRRCSAIVVVVVIVFSYVQCTKESRLRFERHPEGVDYDESYRIKVTRGQEVISSTLTQGGHYRAITLTVSAFNSVFVLDLHLNTYLFAVGYVERSFSKEGVVYHNVNHTESHCYYIGKVRDQSQSTAAVSTCKGIVGYFTVGNISYHIDPASDQLNGRHKVYRGRGDAKTVYRCGHDSFSLNSLLNPERHNRRMKRFIWPQDLDKKNKVVELYVANDHGQYLAKGSVPAVIQRTKDIVNIASAGYQSRGIYLVLVGIEVWDTGDKITVNKTDESSTLDQWAKYRMTYINPIHYNDNGVLITSNSFGSVVGLSVVGLAVVGMMCKNELSAAFVSDVHPLAAVAGSTMDHEMGHNFGLAHDDDISGCVCSDPNGKCIMAAVSNSATPSFTWSECSKDQFANSFQHGLDICLYNVPKTIEPDNSLCGNGIVDNGEQCDCGNSTDQECNKACCNPTTCQLVSPATCAYGRCCNINTCQLLSCGTLCRGKTDLSCDLDEFCDGSSHLCSADTHLPDGANCTVNGVAAYCYDGRCRSHKSQCELLWGPGTLVSVDNCYTQINTRGQYRGNCGINWLPNVTYVPCSASDVMCGLLQCQDFDRTLYYYLKYYIYGGTTFGNGDTCHTALFDFGLDTQDPGFVPSGAKCGSGKMCVDQQCLNISSLNTIPCSSSCQTNEVCNNMGQCQSISGICQQSTTRQQSTTNTPTTTTSTPTATTTKTTPIATTSVPTPTTSTPTTTKTTPILTASTPTPTSTPTTAKSTSIPTTSTPTKTTPFPTTSTPTPTTSTPTTTKTAPILTTSTPTPTTSTPTTTKTTPIPTTSTPTPTTITLTTKTTPVSSASTLTPTASTDTPTRSTPNPTTSAPNKTTSTPTTGTRIPTTNTSNARVSAENPTSTILQALNTSTSAATKPTANQATSNPTPTSRPPLISESTSTPRTSTLTPGAAFASTAVLGIVLGALGLVAAIVLPFVLSRIFCPAAFNSCLQAFTGAARTPARLPLGSGMDQVFTSRDALSPVSSRLQWIPTERYLSPRQDVYTMPVQPQTGNLQPDWNLLRQAQQPFGRGYQYRSVFYTGSQPYSSTNNMKIPQIVIR